MSRIAPLQPGDAEPEARAELERQLAAHGRVTNMKRTLAHSATALQALMTWYPLHDRVAAFLGERATTLFAHAISSDSDCLICSTFFRRIMIESGEDPEALVLDEREQAVVEFGAQLVRDSTDVSDALYGRLAAFLTPAQIVDLTAFAALMIATNVFNNALRVDLDEYLEPYRRPAGPAPGGPGGSRSGMKPPPPERADRTSAVALPAGQPMEPAPPERADRTSAVALPAGQPMEPAPPERADRTSAVALPAGQPAVTPRRIGNRP